MTFFTRTSLMRRLAIVGASLALMLAVFIPAAALAAPAQPAQPQKCAVTDLACVKTFGDTEIAKRLKSLDDLTTRINTMVTKGHLTSAQASPLLGQITTNKSGLTALQTKLDAETDIAAARTDVKNIYLTFRIYAVFIPRTAHVAVLDVMSNIDAKVTALEPKIEAAIAKAPASQKDQLNTLYADFKAQLKEAEAQIDAAQGQLPVLTPNTFNTDKATYQTALTALKTDTTAARDAMKKARNDLHQIAVILKGDKATTPTGTPAA